MTDSQTEFLIEALTAAQTESPTSAQAAPTSE
jgi:hypothetical protein